MPGSLSAVGSHAPFSQFHAVVTDTPLALAHAVSVYPDALRCRFSGCMAFVGWLVLSVLDFIPGDNTFVSEDCNSFFVGFNGFP